MKFYLGEEGLNQTWQEPFPASVKCHKCKSNARIMFVGLEDKDTEKGKFVCDLTRERESKKDKNLWPHDAIAIAVYLCEECFEPNALINQA